MLLDQDIQPSSPPPEFEQLLQNLQGSLRAYVISLLGSHTDADDVVQETNLFLCQRWTEFQPGTSFKAWAFRVAYFKSLAQRRNRIKLDHVEFSEATLYLISQRGHELFGEGNDRLDALQHCLSEITENDRAILRARYSRGASLTDFAKRHRKSPAAIHKVISRLRFALKLCVEKRLSS